MFVKPFVCLSSGGKGFPGGDILHGMASAGGGRHQTEINNCHNMMFFQKNVNFGK